MKELTKKILESGLVPKHTALAMEKWGSLDRGASDIVGTRKVTEETLHAFAEDIAALLEKEEPLRETELDFSAAGQEVVVRVKTGGETHGRLDEMGRIVLTPEAAALFTLGDLVEVQYLHHNYAVGESRTWRIVNLEKVYENETVKAVKLSKDLP